MAKKMYYSEDEAAAALKCTVSQLTDYARQGKLQQYQDGARRVYRAEQVDQFAAQLAMDDSGEINLAPADSAAGSEISLAEADVGQEPGKEDTVITAEGVSIFDDEDLDIEAADPMAKTTISPSLADQVSVDGVGSGSGLLDLTRESDDTSLGAEVLTNIDMESGMGSAVQPAEETAAAEVAMPAVPPAYEAPAIVTASDAGVGLFSGFLVGGAIVSILVGIVAMAALFDTNTALTEAMQANLPIVAGAAAVVVIVSGVVGLVLGKSMAAKQAAMRSIGG
jgi:hypothetical protein